MPEPTFPPLTKKTASLLLYLETCLVDYAGHVDGRRMNAAELETAQEWAAQGALLFGRRPVADIEADPDRRTHWVVFTESAWEAAHRLRRERAARINQSANYL